MLGSLGQRETWAKQCLRQKMQPKYIAEVSGLSLRWVELEARKYGMQEMEVHDVVR